jgi:hypothetical protein
MNLDPHDPLRSLEPEARPPAQLRTRVIRTLRARALLAPRRRRLAAAAAAAVVLVAVAATLLLVRPGGRADGTAYVLLLYEDESFAPDRPLRELVGEYTAWAGADIGPAQPRSELGVVAGLFVIRAADETGALAIARTCPHLRYGGRVVVHPVAGP